MAQPTGQPDKNKEGRYTHVLVELRVNYTGPSRQDGVIGAIDGVFENVASGTLRA